MPVEKRIGTPPRQIVFLAVSIVLGVGSMIFVFTRIGEQSDLTQLQNELGPSVFIAGSAEEMAVGITKNGPLILPDVSGNDRDIYLQHVGTDPGEGWSAFSVRPLTASLECFVQWQAEDREFVDGCDGTTYPETGEGLPSYPVAVDNDGILSVDLG